MEIGYWGLGEWIFKIEYSVLGIAYWSIEKEGRGGFVLKKKQIGTNRKIMQAEDRETT
jgi:hypothetical protein